MAKFSSRAGMLGLGLYVGTAAIFCAATAHTVAKVANDAVTKESVLDRTEKIQAEYVRANEQACASGSLSNCEAADEGRYGLNTFKTARQACATGDNAACDRVKAITPLIIQGANVACEDIKLPSCPGREVITEPANTDVTPNVPNESSNPAATSVPGAVIYNGQAVSPTGGATPPPPPH
jgi:hypothetical protein